MRRLLIVLLAAAAPAWSQTRQQAGDVSGLRVESHDEGAVPEEEEPVRVRAWLDQTALWPGDRVTFSVEISCARDVDVLADDLAAEKLALTGLEVVGEESERLVTETGGPRYLFRYHLTAYDVSQESLSIDERIVRYFVRRPGQRLEDVAPAGETRIPGAVLALRSTLPQGLTAVAVRADRAAAPLPALVAHARTFGLGLVLLAGLPVMLWAAPLVQKMRAAAQRRRARQSRSVTRSALDELRAVDASSAGERRAAYDRIDALVRQHLIEQAGIPATALTADEVQARLVGNGRGLSAEALGELLADCERARYGSAEVLPGAERFRDGVSRVEELLASSR